MSQYWYCGDIKKSKHYLFSVVLILCLVIDLFNFGINLNPLIPASILKEKSKFARILEKDTELFRVIIAPSAFSDFNSQHFHPFLNEKIEDITPLTDAKTLIFPNLNIPFKIQHFNGYDPMRLSVYEKCRILSKNKPHHMILLYLILQMLNI